MIKIIYQILDEKFDSNFTEIRVGYKSRSVSRSLSGQRVHTRKVKENIIVLTSQPITKIHILIQIFKYMLY